jgi:3-hydroxyisobutyrate dehydrogenase-like beta-hydroxyacid dehydrogenase
MNQKKIGLIGYGEVGQAFAERLSSAEGIDIGVFDIRFNSANASDALINTAEKQNLRIEHSIKTIIQGKDLILSAVTCEDAWEVAETSSTHIGEGQIYTDLNTVTPQLKKEMNQLISISGAEFIEVAILGTISSYGFKSPMLACGVKAQEFGDFLNSMGFSVKVLSEKIGTASYMKMLRSIFAKGVESLLFEMLVAAEKCDLMEPVMDAIVAHMDNSSFLNIADTWVTTNVQHAERRADEMDHVIQTLKQLDVQPIMSMATQERLRKCASTNLKEQFENEKDLDYQRVIKSMVERNYS